MRTLYRTFVLSALALALTAGFAHTQVSFAGDARFRPRLDLDDRTDDPAAGWKTSRFYYQYRLRLDVTAAIGEGYYVKTRLGHNGVGFYAHGGSGGLPNLQQGTNTISEPTATRPTVDFLYLYLGRSTKNFGFDLGLLPIPGFTNPLWDLHYYPDQMVDIPYFIWNTDGGFGGHTTAAIGPGRLTVYGLLDRAYGERRETVDRLAVRNNEDQYTVSANYAIPIGKANFAPTVMKTFRAQRAEQLGGGITAPADSGIYNAPLTVGGALTLPPVGRFTPTVFGGWTRSTINSIDTPRPEYDGWLGRFRVAGKVGPGNVLAWADVAQRTDKLAGPQGHDVTFDYLHTWLNYRIPLHTSERGSFSITPQWRFINVDRNNGVTDHLMRRRHKIEIDFDATFK